MRTLLCLYSNKCIIASIRLGRLTGVVPLTSLALLSNNTAAGDDYFHKI